MKIRERLPENETLPVEYFNPSELIGSDELSSADIAKVKAEVAEGMPLDPVIVYEYQGARFILEGNQRTGAHVDMQHQVPAVVVRTDEGFQKLLRSGIKLGKLSQYKTLDQAIAALSSHLRDTRRDVYMKHFNQTIG